MSWSFRQSLGLALLIASPSAMIGCSSWSDGEAPPLDPTPGVVWECRRQCYSGGQPTQTISTGRACTSGFFPLQALIICNGDPSIMCVAGGVKNFPDGLDEEQCPQVLDPVFIGPVMDGAGGWLACEGPCSPGMLTRTNSEYEIEISSADSYVSIVDFNQGVHGPFPLTGKVNLDGTHCAPGQTCGVTIQGMDVAGTGSTTIKGVTYSNPHVFMLGAPSATAARYGDNIGWGAAPGSLRVELNAHETHHDRYRSFDPVHTFAPASFSINHVTGLFTGYMRFTDELGDEVDIVLVGRITNRPPQPVASATVTGTTCNDATVHLDSAGTIDPDGDQTIVGVSWVEGYGTPTSHTLSTERVADVSLGAGEHVISFVAMDDHGAYQKVDTTVVIAAATDSEPPHIDVEQATLCGWAPNHDWISIPYGGALVTDNCDSNPTVQVQVTSSDPANGRGDGNTEPDSIVGEEGLCVRSERSGRGPGRTYSVLISATDSSGNTATATRELVIPHDNRHHGDCIGRTVAECPFEPVEPAPAALAQSNGEGAAMDCAVGAGGRESRSGATSLLAIVAATVLVRFMRRRRMSH